MHKKDWIKAFFVIYLIIVVLSLIFLDNLIVFDEQVALTMSGYSNPLLDQFFYLITYGGSILFWALIVGVFWLLKDKKIATLLILGLVIEIVFTTVLKLGFNRPRPLGAVDALPSFPSSHTTRSFMGAMIMKNYQIIFIILAILVAISRVYLGVHYPSDVLFGAMNGIGIGLLLRLIPRKKIDNFLKKISKKF